MQRYNPKDIEPKWQKQWADSKLYEVHADISRPKQYVTAMFPYPSGAGLHVGHVRNYAITDTIARFQRQNGNNTLSTIGWDGFGLPAENYAIKTGVAPAISTAQNIANFKSQLQQLGMSYDWSREVTTTDPSYYKWTQWLFTQFFERGLAYQKQSLQWWCPHDKTVLANEQVEGGRCWRCGNEVVKRSMKQWFFKITDYADALLDGIDDLDWPDRIKTMQRNWIGRSSGAEVQFAVADNSAVVTVFTTRVDTIYGATFLVLAPEHPLIDIIVSTTQRDATVQYRDQAIKRSEIERQETKDKTGVFTGAYALNPATQQLIPIWVADYVLNGYGTGAIMAVPAHDERDNEFARRFDLPIRYVVEPVSGESQSDEVHKEAIVAIVRNPQTDEILMLDWGPRIERWGGNLFIGGGRDQAETVETCARREIAEETGYTNLKHVKTADYDVHSFYFSNVKNKNYYAKMRGVLFDLLDDTRVDTHLDEGEKDKFSLNWVASKAAGTLVDDAGHRYIYESLIGETVFHGEGLMTNSEAYTAMPSAQAREKVVADLETKGLATETINYKMRDWLISRQRYWGAPIPIIHCPDHGAVAVPAKDLPVILPEVANYEPDGSGLGVLAKATDWVNTICPDCGKPAKRETDTMDGYVCSSWYLFRYADAHNDQAAWDPAIVNYWAPLDYYCGGDHAVAHLLYVRFWTHVFKEMGLTDFAEPIKKLVYNGYIYAADGTKMSKSKGNVVDPLELINSGYGADALRVYELFIGPYEQDNTWDAGGVAGSYRFLNRLWNIAQEFLQIEEQQQGGALNDSFVENDILRTIHRAVKRVTTDLHALSFNTAIAAQMEALNLLYKLKDQDEFSNLDTWRYVLDTLLQLVAPFAPHMSEELWHQLGHDDSIHTSQWPSFDEMYLQEAAITIVVQINGKVRSQLRLPAGSDEQSIVAAAKADEKVHALLIDKTLQKTIYVAQKLVNFVVY
jgi:leucyl-tRNA synthetase